jgi:hypothetical protein
MLGLLLLVSHWDVEALGYKLLGEKRLAIVWNYQMSFKKEVYEIVIFLKSNHLKPNALHHWIIL